MNAAFCTDPPPRFSMVIPAYNEEAWRPRMFNSTGIARERFVRARGAITITSARKFDKHGEWHFLAAMPKSLWWAMFSRKSIDRFARNYWYEDR